MTNKKVHNLDRNFEKNIESLTKKCGDQKEKSHFVTFHSIVQKPQMAPLALMHTFQFVEVFVVNRAAFLVAEKDL